MDEHEGPPQHVDHRRPGEACDLSQCGQGEREGGEGEVPGRVEERSRVTGQRRVEQVEPADQLGRAGRPAHDREEAQLVGQAHLQKDADPEAGQGHAGHRHQAAQVVHPCVRVHRRQDPEGHA
jgi:hypothetical protein